MELDRERLAQVEVRVEEQGGRLNEISQQIKELDRKIDVQIRDLGQQFDQKFVALEAKFDQKFMALHTDMAALDNKLDRKLDGLHLEIMKQFRWTVGIMITLAGLLHFAR